jgi:hypothetical protein
MRLRWKHFRGRVRYRSRQFWEALRTAPLTARDLEPARSVLTDQQLALFTGLQTSEQMHGLRVLQTLQDQGETHPDLLVAALLHDVGKTTHPLHLLDRVIIVLVKRTFPERIKLCGRAQPRGWKRAFAVANQHPAWGADLAQAAGASPLAVSLIREHQNDLPYPATDNLENQLLSALQGADDQN